MSGMENSSFGIFTNTTQHDESSKINVVEFVLYFSLCAFFYMIIVICVLRYLCISDSNFNQTNTLGVILPSNVVVIYDEDNQETNINDITSNINSYINSHIFDTDKECIICFEKSEVMIKTDCGHIMCKDDTYTWLNMKQHDLTCPYCRTSIKLNK